MIQHKQYGSMFLLCCLFMFVYKASIVLVLGAILSLCEVLLENVNIVVCYKWVTYSFKSVIVLTVPLCCTGAIFGALQDILGSRSVSRDYYNQTGRIPDWCCLSSPPPESLYEAGKTPPPLMKRAFSTEK